MKSLYMQQTSFLPSVENVVTFVYDSDKANNMYTVTGLAPLSLSAVLKTNWAVFKCHSKSPVFYFMMYPWSILCSDNSETKQVRL